MSGQSRRSVPWNCGRLTWGEAMRAVRKTPQPGFPPGVKPTHSNSGPSPKYPRRCRSFSIVLNAASGTFDFKFERSSCRSGGVLLQKDICWRQASSLQWPFLGWNTCCYWPYGEVLLLKISGRLWSEQPCPSRTPLPSHENEALTLEQLFDLSRTRIVLHPRFSARASPKTDQLTDQTNQHHLLQLCEQGDCHRDWGTVYNEICDMVLLRWGLYQWSSFQWWLARQDTVKSWKTNSIRQTKTPFASARFTFDYPSPVLTVTEQHHFWFCVLLRFSVYSTLSAVCLRLIAAFFATKYISIKLLNMALTGPEQTNLVLQITRNEKTLKWSEEVNHEFLNKYSLDLDTCQAIRYKVCNSGSESSLSSGDRWHDPSLQFYHASLKTTH